MAPALKGVKRKRTDIQYLRAIAIVSVLGFHLAPSYVPQGFLGVDVFFVLSGYLMTMLLAYGPKKSLSFGTVITFYERRLKRLLPAYVMALAATLAMGAYFLVNHDFNFLRTDAALASLFLTNFGSMFSNDEYFKLVSSYKFLLHTWSLSVELQYYLLAPFLLAIIAFNRFSIPVTFAASFASWAFQTHNSGSVAWSFDFLGARIWQFLVGTLVYYFEKQRTAHEDTFDMRQDNDSYGTLRIASFAVICTVSFAPQLTNHWAYTVLIRLLATAFTGVAMYCGPTANLEFTNSLLSKLLLYLGDISYSVYLFHWPLTILYRYLGNPDDLMGGIKLLVVIFAVSIVQYHLFESQMLTRSSRQVFGICFAFYCVIATFIVAKQGLGMFSVNANAELAWYNQQLADPCYPTIDCNFDPEMLQYVNKTDTLSSYVCSFQGTGKETVFVTGNSYALFQLSAFLKAFDGRYSKLYFIARPSCLIFDVLNNETRPNHHCDEIVNQTVSFMSVFKPDITIITQAMSGFSPLDEKIHSLEEARASYGTRTIGSYLWQFSQFTKKMLFVEPHTAFKFQPAIELAKRLLQNQRLDDFSTSISEWKAHYENGWTRLKLAIEKCPMCSSVEITNIFCDNSKGTCDIYDRPTGISLFCDDIHLSPIGVDRLVLPFKAAVDRVLSELSQGI